jgi:hypothetical protein
MSLSRTRGGVPVEKFASMLTQADYCFGRQAAARRCAGECPAGRTLAWQLIVRAWFDTDAVSEEEARTWGFPDERRLLDAAFTDLPQLHLVDQASMGLGFAYRNFDAERCGVAPLAWALFLMLAMGMRSARAAGFAIAAGYASEAFPQARRLAEFAARADYIAQDRTGQRADSWLAGRGKKPAALVGQEYWEALSPGSHADLEHVQWMSDRTRKEWLDVRAARSHTDRVMCIAVAVGAKDLLVVANREAGELDDALETLQAAITHALNGLDDAT